MFKSSIGQQFCPCFGRSGQDAEDNLKKSFRLHEKIGVHQGSLGADPENH
jgi:hypothetical protein